MRLICAALVFLQQVVVTSVPALMIAVPAGTLLSGTLLSGCSTPAERSDVRQDTRTQERTQDRYERRRGE